MTEQEKREKAIDEISKLICRIDTGFGSCDGDCHLHYTCLSAAIGRDIVNAGYRNADEVRKETAKEIIGVLNVEKGLRQNVVTDYQDKIDNVIKFIKKEFGVEVEE